VRGGGCGPEKAAARRRHFGIFTSVTLLTRPIAASEQPVMALATKV
jgi:hypothetical protein